MKESDSRNLDPGQIHHFGAHNDWWDRDGSYRALHDVNPVRLAFIREAVVARFGGGLDKLSMLDIGCGGGVLSLALAAEGAQLTAIDAEEHAIEAGRKRAAQEKLKIDFRLESADQHQNPQGYDVVICCELLEHVPQYEQLIADCARLLRPNGVVIFSTLTRTPLSFLGAIVGAEYLFNIVPRGTHNYIDFIRPSELDRCARLHALEMTRLSGISYQPWQRRARLSQRIRINYIAAFARSPR